MLKDISTKNLIIFSLSILIILILFSRFLTTNRNKVSTTEDTSTTFEELETYIPPVDPTRRREIASDHQFDITKLPPESLQTIKNSFSKLPVENEDFEFNFSHIVLRYFVYKKSANADLQFRIFLEENSLDSLFKTYPDLLVEVDRHVLRAIEDAEQPFDEIFKNSDQEYDIPSL